MSAITHLLTVQEYAALPDRDDDLKDELIEGEIVLSPRAKYQHSRVVRRLIKLLEPVEAAGFELLVEGGCQIGNKSVTGPDLGVVSKMRTQVLKGNEWLQGSPELVIEVWSPSNRKGSIERKIALYLENGALAVWVVSTQRNTVVVHEKDATTEFRVHESLSLPQPLPQLLIPVAAIFEA